MATQIMENQKHEIDRIKDDLLKWRHALRILFKLKEKLYKMVTRPDSTSHKVKRQHSWNMDVVQIRILKVDKWTLKNWIKSKNICDKLGLTPVKRNERII